MTSIFFSYSHADEALRDELEKHLAALKNSGQIVTWHDRRIVAGQELHNEISENLLSAEVILLLFSSDFLASDYCYSREASAALKRHEAGSAKVVPVILRPCDWQNTPFGALLATPKDGKPITKWTDRDEAFLDVVTAVRSVLKPSTTTSQHFSAVREDRVKPKYTAPRSSNLRVRKTFSDRERDDFIHSAFEYIARFFENSGNELAARNPEVDFSFRRVSANSFEASAYVSGKRATSCGIWIAKQGHHSGEILFSETGLGSGNSYNESMSVDDDENALYLTPSGMSSAMWGQKYSKLNNEGAAEYFWSILIQPLQTG